ncbi:MULTISPECIES: hydantoinase/oxoprolinase family protein [unclassified Mesorhizobium]|uniref:hydantoinase/oxoprolinase family protein n=1 Tax=unclassified Mesorhizobium TaxID=325217 RepID=UPI0024157F7D|nr:MULTISPECIES: hydantoinase/oxoprolinase family protein [unclassified Mesorhizobium]MDG4889978.1 hydantoinase/oxoprolinase family protein [Mesorhizobium sp. WSM4887]MDG4904120.1 hydantoinase/oxoprolinase family protein [Mesorhizobium sp. WSM4962]MDG4909147.1 hydantoinase/oxoprolinase family protein [Mesorhizobium sp. WSM4898]MDG4921771.1 hydantoinase/oxoprolinase family protein [Mesorhizobium sp. WSM4989]
MNLTISVDVGGTFTDIVVDDHGALRFYKSLSNHDDIPQGIMDGIQYVASDRGTSVRDLLKACATFSCGTTAATNAILERRTARTVLICTTGFRDVLRIREGGRENSYEIFEDYPDPLIPRQLTFAVSERINAEGGVELSLDDREVREVLARVKKTEPEAVAVALMWSVMNPRHELRVGELISETLPGVPFSLSHQVNPAVGEYRRTSATALDASLKPVMKDSIGTLATRLADAGFERTPLFVCSNGGRTSGEVIVDKPVFLCLSGPSAAPGAAIRLVGHAGLRERNVISMDLGGTSLDVCMAIDGAVAMQRQGTIAGHVFGVPSVDISTIAAGGGSIARVDAGGFVHVGPQSAGSKPGPACYGLGGERPTLTDANLVRGLLEPGRFGGGHLTLDRQRAVAAISKHVADPLGIGVEDAAAIISAVAEQNMVSAIEDMTMRKGFDPRDFVLVSGGAAGGLHAANLAKELGIRKVLIPRAGSVLSAYGISTGDIKFDFGRIAHSRSDAFDFGLVNSTLAALVAEGTAFLDSMGIDDDRRELLLAAECRYNGQVWQIPVPVGRQSLDAQALTELVLDFHRLHERLYSVASPAEPVEFLEWRIQAVGRVQVRAPTGAAMANFSRRVSTKRQVYLSQKGGWSTIAAFDAGTLPAGSELSGPAIVSDLLTSNFVPAGSRASTTAEGGLLISFD